MKLSTYFTLEEAVHSELAERHDLDNSPTSETLATMVITAAHLDKLRISLGQPILVSSWFRCIELNRLLKSSDKSQHIKGEAVDFSCPAFGPPYKVAQHLAGRIVQLQIDQLILEHSWIHVSFAVNPPREPRHQILSLLANKTYKSGLTDRYGDYYK